MGPRELIVRDGGRVYKVRRGLDGAAYYVAQQRQLGPTGTPYWSPLRPGKPAFDRITTMVTRMRG
jgi:hypothetical protein